MSATEPHHSPEETARLGAEIFDRDVRPALRPEDDGQFVAIDIATGDYELDKDDYGRSRDCASAARRLRSGSGAWASPRPTG